MRPTQRAYDSYVLMTIRARNQLMAEALMLARASLQHAKHRGVG